MNAPVPGGTEQGPGAAPAAAGATPKKGKAKKGKKRNKVHFRRTRKVLGKIPHPALHSRAGVLTLVAGTTIVVAGIVGGVMWFVPYSESVAFCTTCHTMIPQHKSYEVSAHADVACGECHVAPGLAGWVKAKLAGTQELKALVLNNYPTPIPPIPHADMPSTTVTCQKCHSIDRINTPGNPIKLILRPRYDQDESNTMQMVAVAIRPTGLGSTRSAGTNTSEVDTHSGAKSVLDPRGVHWHVAQPVQVYSTDEGYQDIPLVQYQNDQGQTESFINSSEIGLATNVQPDIDRLKSKTINHTMDCIDCHNMVGHNIPDPSKALDESLSKGTISPSLPFIKRDALELLNRNYLSDEMANKAIDKFPVSYVIRNPEAAQDQEAVTSATEEIRKIYTETSTPAMKTTWQSYPDNLGHQRSKGCFRCHDGAHVKVVDGAATDQVIPSTCSTCHTFPQVGSEISGLQLGVPPDSHKDKLFVFSHKGNVASVDAAFDPNAPATAACSTCHQRSYCENCHNSGAVKVTHDEMLYNHAESVKKSSLNACGYCHQPVYCTTCHSSDVTDGMSSPQVQFDPNGTDSGDGTTETPSDGSVTNPSSQPIGDGTISGAAATPPSKPFAGTSAS
jgi:nitrate/TMAO reductase-like tetraheme cytochrome c subunit